MIGFIGSGNMGSAMVEGITAAGLREPQELLVYDQDNIKTENLQKKLGLRVANDISSLCRDSTEIFLSVKPQDMSSLLMNLKPFLKVGHLIITVAAGLGIAFYEDCLGKEQKVMRLMPNTPSLVGEGVIAACKNKNVTPEEERGIISLLKPLGRVVSLEEKYFDAVTALSGSGPAYILLVIEALADGGVEMGLDRELSLLLASQTVLGAAKLFLKTGDHPAILKGRITSPGGITSAGLLTLEEGAVRASFIKAVITGARRSKEMGTAKQQ
ncbi:MAG: pyrroline-5-carboxylate reductase [Bacillota bacterium]